METDSRSPALAWNSDERAWLASHPLGARDVLDFRARSGALESEDEMAHRARGFVRSCRDCDVGAWDEIQRLEHSSGLLKLKRAWRARIFDSFAIVAPNLPAEE